MPRVCLSGKLGSFPELAWVGAEDRAGAAGRSLPASGLYAVQPKKLGLLLHLPPRHPLKLQKKLMSLTTHIIGSRILLTLMAILRDTSRMVLSGGYSLPCDRWCSETSWAIFWGERTKKKKLSFHLPRTSPIHHTKDSSPRSHKKALATMFLHNGEFAFRLTASRTWLQWAFLTAIGHTTTTDHSNVKKYKHRILRLERGRTIAQSCS